MTFALIELYLLFGNTADGGQTSEPTEPTTQTITEEPVSQSTFEGDGSEIEGGSSSEITDGKFAETRKITVEV